MPLDDIQESVVSEAMSNAQRNILVLGYAGTGKTEVAKAIAERWVGVQLTSMSVQRLAVGLSLRFFLYSSPIRLIMSRDCGQKCWRSLLR